MIFPKMSREVCSRIVVAFPWIFRISSKELARDSTKNSFRNPTRDLSMIFCGFFQGFIQEHFYGYSRNFPKNPIRNLFRSFSKAFSGVLPKIPFFIIQNNPRIILAINPVNIQGASLRIAPGNSSRFSNRHSSSNASRDFFRNPTSNTENQILPGVASGIPPGFPRISQESPIDFFQGLLQESNKGFIQVFFFLKFYPIVPLWIASWIYLGIPPKLALKNYPGNTQEFV